MCCGIAQFQRKAAQLIATLACHVGEGPARVVALDDENLISDQIGVKSDHKSKKVIKSTRKVIINQKNCSNPPENCSYRPAQPGIFTPKKVTSYKN